MAGVLLCLIYFINSLSKILLVRGGCIIFFADQSIISVLSADAKFKVGSLNCFANFVVEVRCAFKILRSPRSRTCSLSSAIIAIRIFSRWAKKEFFLYNWIDNFFQIC